MMRNVLATACCRFGSEGLVIKLNFCSDFDHKVWSRFWSWSSGKIWSRSLFSILLLMFCKGNEVESWSRFWSQVWSISWILSLVEILVFADVEILKLVLGQYSDRTGSDRGQTHYGKSQYCFLFLWTFSLAFVTWTLWYSVIKNTFIVNISVSLCLAVSPDRLMNCLSK